jgi:DNA polymerase (family X)
MKRGLEVLKLSKRVYNLLKPFSNKIKIAGSIRRGEKNPVDIDIIIIPKNKNKILESMNKIGKLREGGDKKIYFNVQGTDVEIYYAEQKYWGAMLLAYSSKRGAGIGLRIIAKKRGFHLNQYGLFKNGKFIAGKTEKEIYEALRRKYKSPKLR